MASLFTVFGATGRQGGSVIRSILADPTLKTRFKIRGVTRDVSKPAAQALRAQGVEVVSADMSSKQSLSEAIKGSHSVFLVTTPNWGNGPHDAELTHGKNVADVSKEQGVSHLIFSSLLHVTEKTRGRLSHVSHFDQKAEVERYIRELKIPSTFVLPGYFMDNLTSMGMFRRGDDGTYVLSFPVGEASKFPLIDIEDDLGKFVVAASRNRNELLGKQIYAAAGYYTPLQMVDDFEKVTGKPARFVATTPDAYKSVLPATLADEMLENHLFIEEPGYYAGASLESSLEALKNVFLSPVSWADFLKKHVDIYQ